MMKMLLSYMPRMLQHQGSARDLGLSSQETRKDGSEPLDTPPPATCNLSTPETAKDSSESSQQLDTPTMFIFFPKLPSEIRLKIWNFMLPASRLVHVRFEEPGRIFTNPSLPVTLRVNHESRLESIARLTRVGDSPLGESPPLRYFFSARDIVSIDRHSLGKIAFSFFFWHLQNLLGQEGLSQVRQLAIEDVVWKSINHRNAKPTDWEDWVLKLSKFIIFHKEKPDEGALSDFELVEPRTRDAALEAQVKEAFTHLLPTSSSSRREFEIPEIRVLLARNLETLSPPLPISELQTLEEHMENVVL